MLLRNLFAAAALALAAAVLAATAARATADGPDYFRVTGVTADDVLNIRAGPSAEAAKIGEIPWDGDGIRNLGCQGAPSYAEWEAMTEAERRDAPRGWCRIAYRGIEGWVAARYLAEGSAPAQEADAAAGTAWRFVAVGGAPALGEAEIRFAADGTVSGSTGCNRFSGGGRLDGTALVIDQPMATTRMACADAAVNAQERRILDALQGRLAVAYDPFAGTLALTSEATGTTLRLSGK
ncbi:META domain-containing protein [Aquibium sp. A9E412]|uniref:META domain-containing protein n=1 Tax=Aquibium sp. A9E412 TaxID=2976767 RepID=UPI0025B02B8F|nr:META domain-containing protein [Aquibium sp. A9E412]MDN2566295.1 META domain-containing protein [Aquibium sp. A9E412]